MFLSSSAKALVASSLPLKLSFSQEEPLPKQLLIIRVYGGMDCLLGLNPWVESRPHPRDLYLGRDYDVAQGPRGSEFNLGPSALPLREYALDFSIVNGVFMGANDLGHTSLENYMTTATMTTSSPHFIARPATHEYHRTGERQRLLFNGGLRTFGLEGLTEVHTSSLIGQREERSPLPEEINLFSKGTSSFSLARNALFGADERIRALSRLKSIEENENRLDVEHAVVASFASGYAHFAQIDWDDFNLDNHSNYISRHRENQRGVWTRLTRLLSLLKETPYLDTDIPLFPELLTLMVTTEFSRPPFLNVSEGKDHNPFDNSVLLGGRGIHGGRCVGGHHLFVENRTESQLSGCHIDYTSGRVVKNGYYNTNLPEAVRENRQVALIRPKNIMRTLGEVFHLDQDFERHTRPLSRLLKT